MRAAKSSAISLLICFALSLILIGPIYGYVRGLLTDNYTKLENKAQLADEVRRQASGETVFDRDIRIPVCFPDTNPCQDKLFMMERKDRLLPSGLTASISSAIDAKHEETVDQILRDSSPLKQVSWPVLSLLKSCLDASVAARLCRQYVRHLFEQIPEEHSREAMNKISAADRERDTEWCRISGYFEAGGLKRSANHR